MSTARNYRLAPSAADFYGRSIPAAPASRLPRGLIHRLAQTRYPSPFFASGGSRLTPSSGTVPACYLASSQETTVAEIFGARFDAQRRAGRRLYALPADLVDAYAFFALSHPLPKLALCDLTHAPTLARVGLDLATLHAPDIRLPQAWAELIAGHPARFDGVIYRSRHTDEKCLVLWSRPTGRRLAEELTFAPSDPLRSSPALHALAHHLEMRVSILPR